MHNLTEEAPVDDAAGVDGDAEQTVQGIQYELTLLSRHYMHARKLRPHRKLEQSAYALLTRLELESPMSLKELASAFRLDLSTINRQVAALARKRLVEFVLNPDGGAARKVAPTPLGLHQLSDDRVHSCHGTARVMEHWSDADRERLRALLTRFNQDIERLEGSPWPRPS